MRGGQGVREEGQECWRVALSYQEAGGTCYKLHFTRIVNVITTTAYGIHVRAFVLLD